jgi:uncharacterized RDD family membrane protein YckC
MTDKKDNLNHNPTTPVAGIIRRIAALIYDSFLLFAIWIAVGAFIILPIRFSIYGLPEDNDDWSGFPFIIQIVLSCFILMTLAGYYFVCWRKQGQSLGMKAWRLKLQQPNGELADAKQCILRSLIAPFSIGFFGLGYAWCFVSSSRGCVHDQITGTEVILLPKEK